MKRSIQWLLASGVGLACVPIWAGTAQVQSIAWKIEAQPMSRALTEFVQQSGLQLLFQPDDAENRLAPRIEGTYSPEVALRHLLADSGLRYDFINPHTVVVRVAQHTQTVGETDRTIKLAAESPQSEGAGSATTDARTDAPLPEQQSSKNGVPEVLVKGSRSLNTDIKRTKDDVQPYVVYSRKDIEKSGALNVDDFIKNRLTMNAFVSSNAQVAGLGGNTSTINLRGLGSAQTLILIDGRRAGAFELSGTPAQPDLNGIPLSAIERVEVLPTTASGIYGGSATGGVVNIVLRRDYSGLEAKINYLNTLTNDATSRRVDIASGFDLNGGRTSVMFSGSYSKADPLVVDDRDFLDRGRSTVLANNPRAFTDAASPPLGSTTNISSVRVFNPVTGTFSKPDLVLKNGTSLHSPITFVPIGYSGASSDGGAALAANAGSFNLDAANTAQISGGGRQGLLNSPVVESGRATVRHTFGKVSAFVELAASNNSSYFNTNPLAGTFTISASAPNNPFKQAIAVSTPTFGADQVLVSTLYDRRAVGGLIVQLSKEWQLEADYVWDRTRFYNSSPTGTLTAAGTAAVTTTGAVDVLRDTNVYPVDFSGALAGSSTVPPVHSKLRDSSLRIAGPVLALPAGSVTLTTLLEHRRQAFDDFFLLTPTSQQLFPSRSQSVDSAYMELNLPIFSQRFSMAWARELDVQLAGRFDKYRTNGANIVNLAAPQPVARATNEFTSVDPTVGLRFKPLSDLMFRASYGTGFLPPSVQQLVPGVPVQVPALVSVLNNLRDPRRGNEFLGAFTNTTGGNPDLKPEDSESWSAGIVLTPRLVAGLRISADWTRITKENNITGFALNTAIVNNELFVPGLITRAPKAPGDPFEVGPITAISSALLNASRARVEVYDFQFDYNIVTDRFGTFTLSAAGTHQLHNETQVTLAAPVVERAGSNPDSKWNANATLTADYRSWTFGWTTRYLAPTWINIDHSVNINQGSAKIPGQIYHDLFSSYRIGSESQVALFKNLEVQLGIENLFNRKPPVLVTSATFYDFWGDPRLARYYVTLRKEF